MAKKASSVIAPVVVPKATPSAGSTVKITVPRGLNAESRHKYQLELHRTLEHLSRKSLERRTDAGAVVVTSDKDLCDHAIALVNVGRGLDIAHGWSAQDRMLGVVGDDVGLMLDIASSPSETTTAAIPLQLTQLSEKK